MKTLAIVKKECNGGFMVREITQVGCVYHANS